MLKLVCCIGPTNAGKSTFIDAVKTAISSDGFQAVDANGVPHLRRFATVEVGKLLRAKYGADYFKGQAAPDHTEKEAWKLCEDAVDEALHAGCSHVFIDGQPRRISQMEKMETLAGRLLGPMRDLDYPNLEFLHIYAPTEVRDARMVARDGDDPAKLALSKARLAGDIPALYDILSLISSHRHTLYTLDTSLLSSGGYTGFLFDRYVYSKE
jgi:dephospho-CoA kinase